MNTVTCLRIALPGADQKPKAGKLATTHILLRTDKGLRTKCNRVVPKEDPRWVTKWNTGTLESVTCKFCLKRKAETQAAGEAVAQRAEQAGRKRALKSMESTAVALPSRAVPKPAAKRGRKPKQSQAAYPEQGQVFDEAYPEMGEA